MFIKFPTIENSYQQKHIDKWIQHHPELRDCSYLITEKLDGSNFQIIVSPDGEVQYATRKRVLENTESFFDWQAVVMEGYKDQIDLLRCDAIKQGTYINIYGELYGQGVQKRIHYFDKKDFRVFAMRLNGHVIPPCSAKDILYYMGINDADWWVPIYDIVSSLSEALNFEIPAGVEGVVITPSNKVFEDEQGSVFSLKIKTKEFSDKMKCKHKERKLFKGSDEYNELQNEWNGYVNKNRLADLFSKNGVIEQPGQIGDYIRLMQDDVKVDFFKDHKDAFIKLTDLEKNKLLKSTGALVLPLLKAAL